MLTLILLRHAKSSWDDPHIDDFQRPLAPRGIIAAPVMGAWLSAHGPRPNLILCSSAVRTRATLDLILPSLGDTPPPIAYEDALYMASASDLLARIRQIPARIPTVLMLGHNPGFHDLANALAVSGSIDDRAALAAKYPTAGLAVLTFEVPSWARVAPATGHLAHFVTPSLLQAARAQG
jgi:phosphohistidine phosphatase